MPAKQTREESNDPVSVEDDPAGPVALWLLRHQAGARSLRVLVNPSEAEFCQLWEADSAFAELPRCGRHLTTVQMDVLRAGPMPGESAELAAYLCQLAGLRCSISRDVEAMMPSGPEVWGLYPRTAGRRPALGVGPGLSCGTWYPGEPSAC